MVFFAGSKEEVEDDKEDRDDTTNAAAIKLVEEGEATGRNASEVLQFPSQQGRRTPSPVMIECSSHSRSPM